MNRLSIERRSQILQCLVESMSIRATCRITGAAKGTVLKLLKDIGLACRRFHGERVRDVYVRRLQVDEVWCFVGAKDRTLGERKRMIGLGSVWTFTAMDADTKLMVSWHLGNRDFYSAKTLMLDLAGRITDRFQMTTDGFGTYLDAVAETFGPDIDYAQLVKIYHASKDRDTRYSPATIAGVLVKPISGDPDPAHVSTSFIERQNLKYADGDAPLYEVD